MLLVEATKCPGLKWQNSDVLWYSLLDDSVRSENASADFFSHHTSAGQQLVQAAHFLPGSALAGGNATTIPQRIQPFLKGAYLFSD